MCLKEVFNKSTVCHNPCCEIVDCLRESEETSLQFFYVPRQLYKVSCHFDSLVWVYDN